MNLAAELLLLAYDDAGRKIHDSTRLDLGLGGALLLEMALSERVGVVGKDVVVFDPSPSGDPLVDDALTRIAGDSRSRKPGHWVGKLAKGTRQRVLDHLVSTEILRVEHGSVLWIFPRTTYPPVHGTEPVVETEARHRMRAAVLGTGPVDGRTAALCALVAATELDRKVFADLDRRQVKARLKQIGEGDWAAAAVHQAIQDVQAAIMAGAVAASTAAVISS
ncbi:GPP34 family phosphoprotein [Actinoplanes sp. NPDC020271]|uniref:GOLPH3/VPS74 family protein n=1 Tax=Actinoplanes sp. NPDC020271 TaxID=3363896 RepID=UPI0037A48088